MFPWIRGGGGWKNVHARLHRGLLDNCRHGRCGRMQITSRTYIVERRIHFQLVRFPCEDMEVRELKEGRYAGEEESLSVCRK